MKKSEIVDEIDWLISELKPGIKLSDDHHKAFKAAGINYPCTTVARYCFNLVIKMLKARRSKLL